MLLFQIPQLRFSVWHRSGRFAVGLSEHADVPGCRFAYPLRHGVPRGLRGRNEKEAREDAEWQELWQSESQTFPDWYSESWDPEHYRYVQGRPNPYQDTANLLYNVTYQGKVLHQSKSVPFSVKNGTPQVSSDYNFLLHLTAKPSRQKRTEIPLRFTNSRRTASRPPRCCWVASPRIGCGSAGFGWQFAPFL